MQKMQSKIVLYVNVPDGIAGVREGITGCGVRAIRDGIFAGLGMALLTGGAGALDTFLATSGSSFKLCVLDISQYAQIGYDNPSGWTDWGPC